jgi:predicted O-methyltransferase YrrM
VPPDQAHFERQYARAKAALSRYRGARIVRGFSVEVAATVADASLDFVYLDANHEEAHVRADLEAWVPKVRPGGIVSGHDYTPKPGRKYRQGGPGVVAAVNAYTASHMIRPWFVLEENWLWVKKPVDKQ